MRRCEGYPQAAPAATIDTMTDDVERRAFLFFKTRTAFRILGYHDAAEWIDSLL